MSELIDKQALLEWIEDNAGSHYLPKFELIDEINSGNLTPVSSGDVVGAEPRIGERVRATMNNTDWFSGVYEESVDVFASYGVRVDDTGELKFFIHAEREAALSQVPGGGGWLPIETAPKTRKAHLVWCPAYRNTYVVCWTVPLGEDAKPRPEEGFWQHFGGSRLSERPTHWQPLPEPPASEKGDGT